VALALYRTYRPARLDEVVGQEHVTTALRRALTSDRIHHAYLFSGPRGCGKTSTARILARSLNCEQGPTPDPCGQCQSCIDLAPNGPGSIDVIELDAASHGGVDDTRDLRERAVFAPARSRYKIYIIDEAHMVTTAGFNALLKLVEEPPEHVRFIFATTEAEKVLPTIRSRTHHYGFRLVPTKVLQSHLARVCEAEGIPAEAAALTLIARAGAGSVRDSLSILGQVVAGSGPDGLTYVEAAAQLGVTDTSLLERTVAALIARDGAALFTVIGDVADAGHDPRRFASDLLERLRDIIVVQSVPDAAESGLLDLPDDTVRVITEQAAAVGPAEASRAAELVSAGLSMLKGATAPRLQLELLAARLLLPGADDTARGTAARLDAMERRIAALGVGALAPTVAPAGTPPVAPAVAQQSPATPQAPTAQSAAQSSAAQSSAAQSSAPPAPLSSVTSAARTSARKVEPAPAATPASGAPLTFAEVQSLWPAVLESVKAISRVSWTQFSSSVPLSVDDATLVVALDNPGVVTAVRASGREEALRQAVRDVLRVDRKIEVILDPGRSAPVPSAASATSTPPAAPAPADAPAAAPADDVPSPDDADLDGDGVSGEDLIMRSLGGQRIGEIG
jgi:DNA polymerase-3 subunit gamma/tau